MYYSVANHKYSSSAATENQTDTEYWKSPSRLNILNESIENVCFSRSFCAKGKRIVPSILKHALAFHVFCWLSFSVDNFLVRRWNTLFCLPLEYSILGISCLVNIFNLWSKYLLSLKKNIFGSSVSVLLQNLRYFFSTSILFEVVFLHRTSVI